MPHQHYIADESGKKAKAVNPFEQYGDAMATEYMDFEARNPTLDLTKSVTPGLRFEGRENRQWQQTEDNKLWLFSDGWSIKDQNLKDGYIEKDGIKFPVRIAIQPIQSKPLTMHEEVLDSVVQYVENRKRSVSSPTEPLSPELQSKLSRANTQAEVDGVLSLGQATEKHFKSIAPSKKELNMLTMGAQFGYNLKLNTPPNPPTLTRKQLEAGEEPKGRAFVSVELLELLDIAQVRIEELENRESTIVDKSLREQFERMATLAGLSEPLLGVAINLMQSAYDLSNKKP